jgi:uncharacterized protein YoxC
MSDIEDLTIQNASLHEKTQTTLTDIQGRLSSLPETATSQFGELSSMLENVQHQITILSQGTHQNPTQTSADISQRQELSESLRRLSSLSNERTGEIHSAEARGVLDDLETLIDHTMRDLTNSNAHSRKVNYSIISTSFPSSSEDIVKERALKRMKGHLSSSQTVNLNNGGRPQDQYKSTDLKDTNLVSQLGSFVLESTKKMLFLRLVTINMSYRKAWHLSS